jgi:hypothetical protein
MASASSAARDARVIAELQRTLLDRESSNASTITSLRARVAQLEGGRGAGPAAASGYSALLQLLSLIALLFVALSLLGPYRDLGAQSISLSVQRRLGKNDAE